MLFLVFPEAGEDFDMVNPFSNKFMTSIHHKMILVASFCLIFIGLTLRTQAQESKGLSDNEKKIEEIMQIHYLKPQMKSSQDIISIQGPIALIRVWRDLPPNPDPAKIECLGYQWLLTGRGERMGNGVFEVFKELPELEAVQLELVDIDFDVESVDKKGKLKRAEKVKPYLRMRVEKKQAERFRSKTKELRKVMIDSEKRCIDYGRQLRIAKEINL